MDHIITISNVRVTVTSKQMLSNVTVKKTGQDLYFLDWVFGRVVHWDKILSDIENLCQTVKLSCEIIKIKSIFLAGVSCNNACAGWALNDTNWLIWKERMWWILCLCGAENNVSSDKKPVTYYCRGKCWHKQTSNKFVMDTHFYFHYSFLVFSFVPVIVDSS